MTLIRRKYVWGVFVLGVLAGLAGCYLLEARRAVSGR